MKVKLEKKIRFKEQSQLHAMMVDLTYVSRAQPTVC